jgi:6-phosphofructokinase 2
MSTILTVTFSPAIDKSTSIPALAPEKKLRCSQPKFEPGGGGINVARAIHKLGGTARALYLSGGYSGKFLDQLMEQEGVETEVVETVHHTRENLIVFDHSNGQQYRFGMPGSEVKENEWKALLQRIENSDAQYIVASGSLPPGVPVDVFGQIATIAKKKGARLIVDTSGEALKHAVDVGVYLLKPNLGELSFLVGKEEVNHDLVDDVARDIIAKGACEVVVVSLGGNGAMLVTKEKIVHAIPPVVKRLSTVGAGDSMVAGMVLALSQNKPLEEVLRFGVACGTAATINPGTELCKKEDVERLLPRVRSNPQTP